MTEDPPLSEEVARAQSSLLRLQNKTFNVVMFTFCYLVITCCYLNVKSCSSSGETDCVLQAECYRLSVTD